MYNHPCEYCDGHVERRILDSEIIRVGKVGFVILKAVPVGVCGKCGMQYYHSSVLKRAEEAHRTGGASTLSVPVAPFEKAS